MATDEIPVLAYVWDKPYGPGRVAELTLQVLEVGPRELVLPQVTVRDERPGRVFDSHAAVDLRVDPANGGGPLVSSAAQQRARAFGMVNVAYHAQRALGKVNELLGRELPPLLVRIGLHEQRRCWGGGHYRVPARQFYPVESTPVAATGEVHLGGGSGYVPAAGGGSYFAAPSHNLAIIYHEVGHHICRHTADFRLNRLRPGSEQTNKKVAIEEGSCDLLTAIMLEDPDIYRWHRAMLPESDQRRRQLDPRWTMAYFRGASTDPHADGTIWASACWSARLAVVDRGYPASRFDRMFLRGLTLAADAAGAVLDEDALRRLRYYSGLLGAMLRADPDLTDLVLGAMAAHGIQPAASNARLRDAARVNLAAAVAR